MSFNIIYSPEFSKQLKKLAKKYHSLKEDVKEFKKQLLKNPTSGIHLGNNVYKNRLAIASKGKGKSGGARVIIFVVTIDKEIYLLTIYDKGEKDSISKKEIQKLLKFNNK
ncbi:MAG: hypothetical protein FVQ77_06830 [Cytophagales bacterium]|nr:hypothetical protein [Cytophagales bacterium]